ncbi:MAG: hypothetical protein R3B54_16125, partial [Bdellovibrionota bacterium]
MRGHFFIFLILFCSTLWARTPEGSHARTLTVKRNGAPPGIVDLRTNVTPGAKGVTPGGPFRAKTPRVLGSNIQRNQYSFSSSVGPGPLVRDRTARTPASGNEQAGWGGFDPSLLSVPNFVPPAITSNAGANQSNFDFAKAIAELNQGDDSSIAQSLLDQARNNINNPIEQSGLGSGGSGKGGASSGSGGPGGGNGNKQHNKDLQDQLDRLNRDAQLRDLLNRQRENELRRQLDEIARENGQNGGNREVTPPGENRFEPPKRDHDWSRAGSSDFDLSKLPDGTRSGEAKDLIAANTNGNPGFQYQTDMDSRSRAGCQGSLIHAEKGYCVMATAAHCLDESIYNTGNFTTDSAIGGYTAQVTFRTANFGVIQAVAYMNHEYAVDSWQDTGAVVFRCPEDTAQKITVFE